MIDPIRLLLIIPLERWGTRLQKRQHRWANVVLVTGPTQITLRNNSIKVVNVTSADEMFEKCLSELKKMDY